MNDDKLLNVLIEINITTEGNTPFVYTHNLKCALYIDDMCLT